MSDHARWTAAAGVILCDGVFVPSDEVVERLNRYERIEKLEAENARLRLATAARGMPDAVLGGDGE